MRIAVLVAQGATESALDELNANPGARLLLLPDAARAAHALSHALRAYGAGEDDVLVIRRVGDDAVPCAEWDESLASRATVVDDTSAIDARIAHAARALSEERLEEAEAGYAACASLLGDEVGLRRADVLFCLARVSERRGSAERAASFLDQALAVFPGHVGALAMRQRLARRSGDLSTASLMNRRLFAYATSDEERLALLKQIGDDALGVSIAAMREAARLSPTDLPLMERLRGVLEATGSWEAAVDVAVQVAERIPDPRARARAFASAAELSATRARNTTRAVALYEAAIADDPEAVGAFETIERLLLEGGDFRGAEQAYARQLKRLEGHPFAQAPLLDKLARLREEKLADLPGAIQALDRLVAAKPDDVDALGRLAGLLESNNEDSLAVQVLEVAAQHAPRRVETFRALGRIHTRAGDADRAYAACSVLVHLGEAQKDEQTTYQQFAPEVAVRPMRALDDQDWALLLPRDMDVATLSLLAAVSSAATGARLDEMRANRTSVDLDPGAKQEVERTTVSAVRTAAWVSKFLALPTPDIYLRPQDAGGGVSLLLTRDPTVGLGPAILSGRSVGELAFLLARELAHVRMTGRLLAFYPELTELRALVTAAISLVVEPKGRLPAEVERPRRELERRLDATSRARLVDAVEAIHHRGGQLDLLALLRASERTACRVGLLACGDLTIAARVLSVDGRVTFGLSAADRVRDLVPFSVSRSYAEVRSALGIAARASHVPDAWG